MKVFFSEHFRVQIKKLKKKFPHAKEDVLRCLDSLQLENEVYIGKSIYKIRIQSSDSNKGKSGGFRSYIYIYRKRNLLVPLCMYHKSRNEAITNAELNYHFAQTVIELIAKLSWNEQ